MVTLYLWAVCLQNLLFEGIVCLGDSRRRFSLFLTLTLSLSLSDSRFALEESKDGASAVFVRKVADKGFAMVSEAEP